MKPKMWQALFSSAPISSVDNLQLYMLIKNLSFWGQTESL